MKIKSLITLLISILFALRSFAQDTVQTQVATLTLPKGTQKLPEQQVKAYTKNHFKREHIVLPNDHTYAKDGMLITIREVVNSNVNKTLESLKREFEGVFKETGGTYNTSEIIMINNRRFYIFNYGRGDEGYWSFYSDFDKGKNFMGTIDYKLTNEKQAHDYMNTLLQRLRFRHYKN
ncbi:hypothetical protein [Mucilaginibacter sp.]